jgi:hypothetical protein
MTPYEVFEIYHSLKLHFTQESFDFYKYNGKSRISLDAFDKRKDKWHFAKLSRKFNNKDELINFLVSNFLEDDKTWVGSLLEPNADILYQQRKKVLQSLSYFFENDCRLLFEGMNDPNEIIRVKNGDHPILLRKTMQKVTQTETLCILASLLKFFPMWKEKIQDTIIWPNFYMKVLKYSAFLPKDDMKYKLILKKVLNP